MDVFFVLSGFIMFVSTAGRRENARRVPAAPGGRVVPLYWLVTLALALIARPA